MASFIGAAPHRYCRAVTAKKDAGHTIQIAEVDETGKSIEMKDAHQLSTLGHWLLAKWCASTPPGCAATAEAKTAAATTTTATSTEAAPVAINAALAKRLHVLPALFCPELLTTLARSLITILELARDVVEEA